MPKIKLGLTMVGIALVRASDAMAQAAGQAPDAARQPSMLEWLVMPAGFLIIMYFFIFRPQQKRAREHTNLLSGLKAGDEVVTTGGIIGRIKTVAETFVTLEVSNNTSLKVLKSAVTSMTKPTPPKEAASKS